MKKCFLIFTKTSFMFKTRTYGQKWLPDELVLFLGSQEACQISIQSDNFSRVIVFTDAGQTTDRRQTYRHFLKNRFFRLRASQNLEI